MAKKEESRQLDDPTVQPDGEKIKQLRKNKFLTVDELAKDAKLAPETVRRAEAGNRVRRSTIRRIAEVLGVLPEELVISDKSPASAMTASGLASSIELNQLGSDLVHLLSLSGLANAFRVSVAAENHRRETRVAELVAEERRRSEPRKFRLLASSGFNYLHRMGKVWLAGLGEAITQLEADFEVILESPFSEFSMARALANQVEHNQWEDKVTLQRLEYLDAQKKVTIHVTEHPVNCSLFFTSDAVFYDPYLWALLNSGGITENNFWVFEFRRAVNKEYDCYCLLKKHFDFLAHESKPLKEFMGTGRRQYDESNRAFLEKLQERKSKRPYGTTFCP